MDKKQQPKANPQQQKQQQKPGQTSTNKNPAHKK